MIHVDRTAVKEPAALKRLRAGAPMPLRLSPQQDQPPAEKGQGARFAELCAVFAVALGVIGLLVGIGLGVFG
jgi:hypothetical protein